MSIITLNNYLLYAIESMMLDVSICVVATNFRSSVYGVGVKVTTTTRTEVLRCKMLLTLDRKKIKQWKKLLCGVGRAEVLRMDSNVFISLPRQCCIL